MTTTFCVYRLLDADDGLLYVGCSTGLVARLGNHRSYKEWWPQVATVRVEHYAFHVEALAAERRAIASEGARYNVLPADNARKARATRRANDARLKAKRLAGEYPFDPASRERVRYYRAAQAYRAAVEQLAAELTAENEQAS